ncbi:MAG: hypothetical protein GJ680_12240 [Alteromonadaceae bacterium]|nr:hypothetical protein [Alteromonadaceae bacterium]
MALHREEKLELAQAVFDLAMLFDQRHNLTRYKAGIHNNSGVLALEMADYARARKHFEQALDIRHKDSHLPGQVTAGTNLLLSLFLQKEWETFERLVDRVGRLHARHGSDLLRRYYDWLHRAYALREQSSLSQEQQADLEYLYTSIDDHFIQVFLAQAATNMHWSMPTPIPETPKPGATIDIRPYFSFCDWEQLAKVKNSDIVTLLEQKQHSLSKP